MGHVVALALLAFTANAVDIDSDMYVVYYQAKVDVAKALVERTKTDAGFEFQQLEIVERLYQKNATSLSDLLTHRQRYQFVLKGLDLANAELKQRELLLEVIKDQRKAGKEVPLCNG